jgi:hypothetical protein
MFIGPHDFRCQAARISPVPEKRRGGGLWSASGREKRIDYRVKRAFADWRFSSIAIPAIMIPTTVPVSCLAVPTVIVGIPVPAVLIEIASEFSTVLANFSTVLPNLTKTLSDFGSTSSDFRRASAAPYIPMELGFVLVEISQVAAQFDSIFE